MNDIEELEGNLNCNDLRGALKKPRRGKTLIRSVLAPSSEARSP